MASNWKYRWEHDRRRAARGFGPGSGAQAWMMIAPECAAEGCANGASYAGCCLEHSFTSVQIKERWLKAEPERWRALNQLLDEARHTRAA